MFWKFKKNQNQCVSSDSKHTTLPTKTLAILEKQKDISLSFFVSLIHHSDQIQPDIIQSHHVLLNLLYPYNIGLHFRRGTDSIKNSLGGFYMNYPEHVKQTIILIQEDIMKINIYMEKQKIQYLSFQEIQKKVFNSDQGVIKTHYLFSKKIKNYYLYIFPLVERIVNILDDDTILEKDKYLKTEIITNKCLQLLEKIESLNVSVFDEWKHTFYEDIENKYETI